MSPGREEESGPFDSCTKRENWEPHHIKATYDGNSPPGIQGSPANRKEYWETKEQTNVYSQY